MFNVDIKSFIFVYRHRKPTKAKSQEPAYSQALIQNKIDKQRVISGESDRQKIRRLSWWTVFGVETGREVGRWEQMRIVLFCWRTMF